MHAVANTCRDNGGGICSFFLVLTLGADIALGGQKSVRLNRPPPKDCQKFAIEFFGIRSCVPFYEARRIPAPPPASLSLSWRLSALRKPVCRCRPFLRPRDAVDLKCRQIDAPRDWERNGVFCRVKAQFKVLASVFQHSTRRFPLRVLPLSCPPKPAASSFLSSPPPTERDVNLFLLVPTTTTYLLLQHPSFAPSAKLGDSLEEACASSILCLGRKKEMRTGGQAKVTNVRREVTGNNSYVGT